MSDKGTPDISKIISLIMENPQIIEQISALAKNSEEKTSVTVQSESTEATAPDTSAVAAEPKPLINGRHADRTKLLSAFKPYLSTERKKAIDSMISISEILEAIRR